MLDLNELHAPSLGELGGRQIESAEKSRADTEAAHLDIAEDHRPFAHPMDMTGSMPLHLFLYTNTVRFEQDEPEQIRIISIGHVAGHMDLLASEEPRERDLRIGTWTSEYDHPGRIESEAKINRGHHKIQCGRMYIMG